MAKVDGFNVQFSHRGAWTADLLAPGKEVAVIPVAWDKDFDVKAKTLFVWLKKEEEVASYMGRERFRAAVARWSNGAGSSENITGIFWAKPMIASSAPKQGVMCSIEGRAKPGDPD